MSDDSTRPYSVDVPLRWSDMDANRHVNNVQFVRLLEEARVIGMREWFGDLGHDKQPLMVARTEIDYLRQMPYRPTISVAMWVTRVAGASFDLGYEMRAADGSELYARSETTLVAVDLASGRPARLTPEMRNDLARYAGPQVAMKRRSR
ncbi:acyl-CoA thioesterase [Calidifontibacter terrae]